MVNKLNAGSLPARLIEQPISEKTIGPSIGANNRDQGIRAGLIGLVAVIAVMLVYYLAAGAIADVALLMNILFVLAIMAGLRATFTLPGIAGIILTIGMSVDANVLIFERIREEQGKGTGLATAIRNGYQRAFRAIFDANLTTFITAAILYNVASEEIKGFAIVLMLGIASSMFTALFVSRVVFDLLVSKRIIKEHIVMLRLIHEPKVNWMGMRKVFFAISAVMIASGLAVFFTRDNTENNKYDIEFTGGTSVQINLKEGVSLSRQCSGAYCQHWQGVGKSRPTGRQRLQRRRVRPTVRDHHNRHEQDESRSDVCGRRVSNDRFRDRGRRRRPVR
jgi:SecD/SecF fusion protein